MTRRVPLYLAGQAAYLVTTSDRRMFRCSLERVGKSKPELRWIFRDTERRYIGPPAVAARYLDELQATVEAWWHDKQQNRHAGVDSSAQRARLLSLDD